MRRRGLYVRLRTATIGALAMALLSATSAAAATYPSPPHDFAPVAGAGPLYNVASGSNPRPLLTVVVTFTDLTSPPSVADATISQRVYGPAFPNLVDYYRANSFGKMFFTRATETCDTANDGVIRITLGTQAAYLGQTDSAQDRSILDAVNARGCINFTNFDRNNDKHLTDDEMTILAVDATNRNCGATRGIDGPPTYNGVQINKSVSKAAGATNIVTLAHEVGHSALDAVDLYGDGAGSFDLYGPTCGPPDDTMQGVNAWQKTHLGWITPTVVGRDGYADVPRADTNPSAFILYDPDRGTNDYFIAENRERHPGSYDKDATADGLVIWRADDSKYNSGSETIRGIEIMRTDGQRANGCAETPGSCYGGSTGDAWNRADPSTPQDTMAREWRDGTPSKVAVRAICDAADTMRVYFDVRGPGVLVNTCHRAADILHPGDPTTVDFPVMNTGEATAAFDFTVTNLPAGWTASTDTQTLGAGAGSVAHVQITPTGDAGTGPYSYRVRGTSTSDGSINSDAPATGTVVLDRTAIDYTGSTLQPTGEPAGFRARVTDPDTGDSPVAGDPVTFRLDEVGGSNTLSVTQATDGGGGASASPTLTVPAGAYTLTVSVPRLTRHASASIATPYTVIRRPTTIVYGGDLTQDYHDPATLTATLTDTISGAPLGSKPVSFTLGTQGAPATTSGTGVASATIVIEQPAGTVSASAAFAGDVTYQPSSVSVSFEITKEETTTQYTGDSGLIANGRTAHLAGVLKEDGIVPIAGRTLTLTLGSGASAQSCTATTDATGTAGCTIDPVVQPLGPGTATASFASDAFYLASSGSGATVIFQPGGAFAIQATGLLKVPRQPNVTCPPGGSARQAVLSTPVGAVTGFNASCATDPVTGTTTPAASIDSVVLLGGALRITNIRSACTGGPGGISCSSSVGTVNGITIGSGPVTLDIPLVGRVALNEIQSNGAGRPVRNAVRVVTALQQIILAESYFN
jgi:M6 family metalloprotease-like protein